MTNILKQTKEIENVYFGIGSKYWHLFKALRIDGTVQIELHPWNKRTIVAEFGRDFPGQIKRFNIAVDFDHEKRRPDIFYFCDFVKVRGKKPGRKTPFWYYVLGDTARFFQHVKFSAS